MESEASIYKTPHSTVVESHPEQAEVTRGYAELLKELGIEGFHEEQDPIAESSFEASYESFLSNEDSIIGSGNHAIVFDTLSDSEGSTLCAKGIWSRGLSVACRNKTSGILPHKYERLRAVQRYYDLISEKRREYASAGINFVSQTGALDEALITNIAHEIAKKTGLGAMVPHVDMVIEYHRSDEGEANDARKSPFMVSEHVHFLVMTKVHGSTVEQIVLSEKKSPLLDRVNFSTFKSSVLKLIAGLHEKGMYHNDISTRNIMVDREGNPHLIDFGAGSSGAKDEVAYAKNVDQAEQVLDLLERAIESPESAKAWLEEKIGE